MAVSLKWTVPVVLLQLQRVCTARQLHGAATMVRQPLQLKFGTEFAAKKA
jgi:hypothetical protein